MTGKATLFGKSPAALYLSDLLKDDTKRARKASRYLQSVHEPIAELTKAHEAGHITAKTLARMLSMISSSVQQDAYGNEDHFYMKTNFMERCKSEANYEAKKAELLLDFQVSNLLANIAQADIKLWKNRVAKARVKEVRAKVAQGETRPKVTATPFEGEKTDQTVIARSQKKLSRLGKPNNLYPAS